MDVELLHETVAVTGRRPEADPQADADLFGGMALGDESEDFEFPRGEIFDLPAQLSNLRKDLLFKHHIITGEAKPNTIRLLPSLALKKEEAETLVRVLDTELKQAVVS